MPEVALVEFIFHLEIERGRLRGKRAKGFLQQRGDHLVPFAGKRSGVADLRRLRQRNERIVNGADPVSLGRAVHVNAQRFQRLLLFGSVVDVADLVDRHVAPHQVLGKPRENLRARTFVIRMAARRLDQSQVFLRAQIGVQPLQLLVHLADRFNREDAVVIRRSDHQRTRRDQCADIGQIPAVGVDPPHAVAVAVNRTILNVREQRRGAADRCGGLDSFVARGNPPRSRAAAGDAGDAELVRIDFAPLREQIEPANAVEQFHPRRRVTARIPVPPAFAIAAVMKPRGFAELHRFDDQADKAQFCEAPRMRLVVMLLILRMAADVEDRRGAPGQLVRDVKIRRDVQLGQALVVELLDAVGFTLHHAGDFDRGWIALFAPPGVETHHFQKLLPLFRQ